MAKSFKSKAINAVLSAIIRTLLSWAEEWSEDAFFFIVIGDKQCTDIAWFNAEELSCNAALAITSDPETLAAFNDIAGSVDILAEDALKDDSFREKYEPTTPFNNPCGWFSSELDDK